MALFTGREGNAALSRRKFEDYQRSIDTQNARAQMKDFVADVKPGEVIPKRAGIDPWGYENDVKPAVRGDVPAQATQTQQQVPQEQAPAPAPQSSVSLPNRQGTMGAEGIDQIQPDSTAPGQWIEGQSAGMDVTKALQQIKARTATGGYADIPATSPLARGWAWLTKAANDPYHANQAGAKEMTDWVRTPEFDNLIRNDPNRIAEFNADPMGFHQKYAGQKAAPAVTEDRAVSGWKPVPPIKIEPGSGRNTGLYDMIQYQESRNDPNAVNPNTGAFGLMQLMPDTAKKPGFGVTPLRDNSPEENRRFGEDYYEAMLNRYGGNMSAALAAYNWGPGNADGWMKYGANPAELPKETRDYVSAIMTNYGGEPFGETSPAVGAAPQQVAEVAPTQQQGGVKTGAKDPAAQLATAKDPTSVAAPEANLAFTLRSDQMQALLQQRDAMALQGRYNILSAVGPMAQAAAMVQVQTEIMAHDVTIGSMAKKQAIDLMSKNKDPRMLNRLLSERSGTQYEYGPNADGTWYESVDGVVTIPSIKLSKIIDIQLSAADREYYQQMKNLKSEAAAKQFEMELEAILKIQVKNAEQNNEAYIEILKKGGFTKGTDGDYWTSPQGKAYRIVEREGMDDGPPTIQLVPITATSGLGAYQTGAG